MAQPAGTQEKGTLFQGALPVLPAQPPKMEWNPDQQTEENDRRCDLDPDDAAYFLERHFEAGAPRLRQQVPHGLHRMGHKPQPIPYPLGVVYKGGQDPPPRPRSPQETAPLTLPHLRHG